MIESDLPPEELGAAGTPAAPPRRRRYYLLLLPLVPVLVALVLALRPLGAADSPGDGVAPNARTITSAYKFTSGMAAPEFALSSLEDKNVSLQEFRGHPVLLNFWATWCIPCRSEMPDMQQLYEERKGDGLVVLAVNVAEQDRQQIGSFVKQLGLTFPILLDSTGEISQTFGVQALPTTFFIDRDGKISSFNMGALNKSAMARRLDNALQ